MKNLLIVLSVLLAACSGDPVRPPLEDVVLAPNTETVNVPKNLLVKCPLLPKLEVRKYTEKEVVVIDKSWIDMYDTCRTNNSVLIDTVRKAFNIPDETKVVNKVQ
jgi:hypothetical protein